MVNLLLTNYCNRSCPYCFAKQKVSLEKEGGLEKEQISVENAKKVAEFFKDVRQMGLLGGEPTLHPKFKEIVNIFLERGYRLTLFTNGIFTEDALDFLLDALDKKHQISFLFNINEPKFYKPDEWKILERNLKELSKNSSGRVSIGINFFYLKQDYKYMLDLARKYKISSIRWDIAHPIVNEKNVTIPLEDYPKMGDKIADFAEEAKKQNIQLRADCGASVYCMFSKEAREKLFKANTQGFFNICTDGGAIDVGVDLRVWRCFPLSRYYNKHLSEFKNLDDIRNYFNKLYSYFFFDVFPMDKCYLCKYALKKRCTGSCLARSIIKFLDREKFFLDEFYMPLFDKLKERKVLCLLDNETLKEKFKDSKRVIFYKNKNDFNMEYDILVSDFLQHFNPVKVKLFKTEKEIFPEKIKVFATNANVDKDVDWEGFIKVPSSLIKEKSDDSELIYSTDLKEINWKKHEIKIKPENGKNCLMLYYECKSKYFKEEPFYSSLQKNGFVWLYDLENSKIQSLNIKGMIEENGRE